MFSKFSFSFQVRAAELVAHTAHDLGCQEQWNEALAKYTLAIESAMHVLSNENRGTERSIRLQRRVSSWLSAAERIKVCFIFASGFFQSVVLLSE